VIEAGTHVLCLLIGYYLCYATLAGRLLPKRKFSMAEQEAVRKQYNLQKKEEDEPSFVKDQLAAYQLDQDTYKLGTPTAGRVPLRKRVNDGRASSILATAPGGGRVEPPKGTGQDQKASGKTPD